MMLSCDSYQQFPLAAAFHIAIVPHLVQLIIMHRLMATLCACRHISDVRLLSYLVRPNNRRAMLYVNAMYTRWGVAGAKTFLLGVRYNKLSTDKTICSPPPRHLHRVLN